MSGWRGNNQVWEDEEENADTLTCEGRAAGEQRESNAGLVN